MDTFAQSIAWVVAVVLALIFIYITARLISVAWHNSKAEYELRKGERRHGSYEKQDQEEDQQHS